MTQTVTVRLPMDKTLEGLIQSKIDEALEKAKKKWLAELKGDVEELIYDPDQELTSAQAAEILGLSSRTLANWRTRPPPHGGPPYRKPGGRVFYVRRELKEWQQANKRTHT